MSKQPIDSATDVVIRKLITEIAGLLNQAVVQANAASKLASQGRANAALTALMDVEPSAHEALDLYRAVMSLRTHLLRPSISPARKT